MTCRWMTRRRKHKQRKRRTRSSGGFPEAVGGVCTVYQVETERDLLGGREKIKWSVWKSTTLRRRTRQLAQTTPRKGPHLRARMRDGTGKTDQSVSLALTTKKAWIASICGDIRRDHQLNHSIRSVCRDRLRSRYEVNEQLALRHLRLWRPG